MVWGEWGYSGGNGLTMRGARGEIVRGNEGVVRVSRMSRKGRSEGGEQRGGLMGRDHSPYVYMSKRKLLMDSIMYDTIRTHEGRG